MSNSLPSCSLWSNWGRQNRCVIHQLEMYALKSRILHIQACVSWESHSDMLIFEQKPEISERVNHLSIWGISIMVEGTASAQGLGQENA